MDYPEYVKVNNKLYKINTDFRIALECIKISEDETIGDCERALAIIYLLFGEEGLEAYENHDKLMEKAKKYFLCGQEELEEKEETPDMDFIEDIDYIEASFRSDYGMDLEKEKMHWWKFYHLIEGLSDSELGNCCVLNRVRNLRNYDTSKIKDQKEKDRIEKAKKRVELKKYKKENNLTAEQERSMAEFNKKIGL